MATEAGTGKAEGSAPFWPLSPSTPDNGAENARREAVRETKPTLETGPGEETPAKGEEPDRMVVASWKSGWRRAMTRSAAYAARETAASAAGAEGTEATMAAAAAGDASVGL